MIGAYMRVFTVAPKLSNKVLSNGCQKKHFDKNGWQEMWAGKPFREFKTTQ